ncbi:hypothetical protein pb186bvf_014135 [Paramecium bursaria]
MEQIYIKTSLLKKFDNKTVAERIQILQQKFQDVGIQNYNSFLQYISNQGDSYQFQQESDQTQKSILIEFHKFCRYIQQEINNFQDNCIIQLLEQVEISIKPILVNVLIELLNDNFINQQIPDLQKQIQNINQLKSDPNKIQIKILQQDFQQVPFPNIKDDSFKILILGAVGTGKTTLANKLINYIALSDRSLFNHTNNIDGGTKKLSFQSVRYKNIDIDILDSPGFGNIETNVKQMILDLYSVTKTINMIIYCFNVTILRCTRQDLLTISIIQGLYSESWDNLYVSFNFLDLQDQIEQKEPKFQVIDSINLRLKSNIPQNNIIYNDDKISYNIVQLMEQQHQTHQYKKGFKKMTIPNITLIEERCQKYLN